MRSRNSIPDTFESACAFAPYIYATQEVIDRSRRKNRFLCVVTRAIASSVIGAVRITADRHRIAFSVGKFRYRYDTPALIAPRIANYDTTGKIKPFQFRLQLATVRPVVSSKASTSLPKGKKRKYVFSGKHAGKFKCGRWSSARWHGVKIARES